MPVPGYQPRKLKEKVFFHLLEPQLWRAVCCAAEKRLSCGNGGTYRTSGESTIWFFFFFSELAIGHDNRWCSHHRVPEQKCFANLCRFTAMYSGIQTLSLSLTVCSSRQSHWYLLKPIVSSFDNLDNTIYLFIVVPTNITHELWSWSNTNTVPTMGHDCSMPEGTPGINRKQDVK